MKSGELEMILNAHTVAGKLVDLTPKEYKLLRLFMENAGQMFSRERLL